MQYGKDPDLSLSTLSSASCFLCMCSSLFVLSFRELYPLPLLPRHPCSGTSIYRLAQVPLGGVWAPFLPPHHKLVHLILNTCRFVCPGSPLPFLAPTVSSVRMFLIVVPRAGHTECPESAFAGVANEEAVRGAWQACYSLGLHSAPWSGHCGRGGRRGFQAQDPLLSPQVCAGAGASSTQE